MGSRDQIYSYRLTVGIAMALTLVYIAQHYIGPAFLSISRDSPLYLSYAADTSDPIDPLSYLTAAVTHASGAHLVRNLLLLGAAGLVLEPRVPRKLILGAFGMTAITGIATFAITGYFAGADRLGSGASGGTFALFTLAILTISSITVDGYAPSLPVPAWAGPLSISACELFRALYAPVVSASPYPNYAHIAGVWVAVGIWIAMDGPRWPRVISKNPKS